MKIVSVEWLDGELDRVDMARDLLDIVEHRLKQAAREAADMVVLPAFSGAFFQQLVSCRGTPLEIAADAVADGYVSSIVELASKYHQIICPGSFWEMDGESIYHTSCIISDNKIVLKQRQLYLSRWEREAGLERGQSVSTVELKGFKTGIVLSTDVFYPQVSRILLSMNVDLVLSPIGFTGSVSKALQLSGMWQEVQQNLFYAVESGFNGKVAGIRLWGKSRIHAPLEISPKSDGSLADVDDKTGMVAVTVDYDRRLKLAEESDVLAQLNPGFYRRMHMFGGGV